MKIIALPVSIFLLVYDLVVEYFGAEFLGYYVFMAMPSELPRKTPMPLKIFKRRDWNIRDVIENLK